MGLDGRERKDKDDSFDRVRFVLLTSDDPMEKVVAVAESDPLELLAIAQTRCRARHLLLEPARVQDEAIYHVVQMSPMLTREEDFESWILARVDEAVDHVLRQDGEALVNDSISDEVVEVSRAFLAQVFDLDTRLAVRCAARFNVLPKETRQVYCALFLQGRTLAQCLEAGLGSRDELRTRVQLAVDTILGEVALEPTRSPGPGPSARGDLGGERG